MNEIIAKLYLLLDFKGMFESKITNVEENCGTIWFNYDNETYYISINKCDKEKKC